jgi:ribonuclease-3
MAKRPRSETDETDSLQDSSSVSAVSKRAKADDDTTSIKDALSILLENADDLIDCIELLRSESKEQVPEFQSLQRSTRKKLSKLSKKLLPVFKEVRSRGKSKGEEEESVVRDETEPADGNPTALFTRWTSSDIPTGLPPLPPILDADMEVAALTHPAMTSDSARKSYERLEWIGDACIEMIASSLIYETFPFLLPGKSAQMRERLVCNKTLGKYTVSYGLDKRARLPEEFRGRGDNGRTVMTEKEELKILGDILEAYVGALVMSEPDQSMTRASIWLKQIWATELAMEIRNEEVRRPSLPGQHNNTVSQNQESSAKQTLSQQIMAPGIKLQYEDILDAKPQRNPHNPNSKLFTVGVFLTGWGEHHKKLGQGTAPSKKEAGGLAAQMALDDEKLLRRYRNMKQEYLAKQRAQKAEGGTDHQPE